MPSPISYPSPARFAAGVLALAAVYYAAGVAGHQSAYFDKQLPFAWSPTGVAVAALFRGGLRYALGVAVGSFLVNRPFAGAWVAAGVAMGNALGPVAAVLLLRRAGFDRLFSRPADVVAFVGLAGGVGAGVSAMNAAGWAMLSGARGCVDAFPVLWMTDSASVLGLAPVGLLAARGRRPAAGRAVAAAAAVLVPLAVGVVVFRDVLGIVPAGLPIAFVPMLSLAWLALRYRTFATTAGGLVLVAVAVWGTAAGHGPFGPWEGPTRTFLLWAYVCTVGVVPLLMTAVSAGRDRAERSLVASEAEYRAIVEDNPAMICRFRPDGTLTFANATYRDVFGGTRDEAGRRFLGACDPAARGELLSAARRMTITSSPVAADCPVVRADGGTAWYRWTVRTVDVSSGFASEFHAVGLDVTEQRLAEDGRRAFEAKMVQTQKLESVGVLAGGIAHEFNNLLTSILGNAELAAMDAAPGSPLADSLAAVASAASRAAHLTKQLTAYAGKGAAPTGPVNLSELVRVAADLISVSLPRRCEVTYALADGLPAVHADEGELRQLLVNLIANAGEAAGDAGGAVQVRTGRAAFDPAGRTGWAFDDNLPAGNYVKLEVVDAGPGMTPDVAGRAFEPFFTTKFPGRGLGLAAVLGIVRGHGGAVKLATAPGLGTTVTVLLRPFDPRAKGTKSGLRFRPGHTPPPPVA